MVQRPKIEFYKLKLKNKEDNQPTTFRNLFRDKFDLHGKELDLKGFFDEYFQAIVKELDGEGYYIDEKRQKGYTVDYKENENGERKSRLEPDADNWILAGVLDGGKHGMKRTLGDIGNKSDKQPIEENNIVCDKFYFLLSTPIDHSEAIMMIQGYSELNISNIFRDHMRTFFSHGRNYKCEVEIYVPEALREEYLEGATFDSATFSTGWAVTPDFEDIESKAYDLQVKLEIKDKSNEKMSYEETQNLVQMFGQSILKMGNKLSTRKKLSDFESKRAKINSKSANPIPIKFENNHIKPVVYLENEGIGFNEDSGELDFEMVGSYCRKVLNQINEEDSPNNAVEEL